MKTWITPTEVILAAAHFHVQCMDLDIQFL